MSRHLWWILGLVLMAVGVTIALSSRTDPNDFGWFAYAPLSNDPDWQMTWSDRPSLIVARRQLAGAAVAATGLAVLSASIGFHLGRRRA